MRIVAGELRGRRLVAPTGSGVRPTLEVVREAIFDSIGPRVVGARVLDLFAGCGALGFEALSRGAEHVTWCDSSDRAAAAIRENATKLGIAGGRATLLVMTAHGAMTRLARSHATFDLVFVDPPYEGGLYNNTLLELSTLHLVAPGGTVAVEYAKRIDVSSAFGELTLRKKRVYGETNVAYFDRAGGDL